MSARRFPLDPPPIVVHYYFGRSSNVDPDTVLKAVAGRRGAR